jgi:hypothetical protein
MSFWLSEIPQAALSALLEGRLLSELWFRRYTYGVDALDHDLSAVAYVPRSRLSS